VADLRDPEQLPGVSRATGVDLAEQMQYLYARAEHQIAQRIAKNIAAGIASPTWALDKLLGLGQLNDWTRTLLRRLGSDVADEVRYSMLSAYLRGGTEATRALAEASDTLPEWINRSGVRPGEEIQRLLDGRRSKLAAGIADIARSLPGIANLQRMIGSLALRITGTHLPVLRWADDAYRQVVAEPALTPVLLGTAVRRAGSQRAWEQLLSEGITGFTDKSGRGWNLASYVEMATRTGVAQAAVEGHLDRLTDAGIELVIVSNAPQECKRCRPWEGKILARSGPDGRRTITVEHATEDRQIEVEVAGTVDEAIRAGLMHPNCRHSVNAYLPGTTRVPTNTEDPEGDAARQKLRRLEREVRQAKLKAGAVIDPDAQPRLDAAVRAKQKQIREHVAATEHLGIMRKPERERLDLGNSSGLDAGKQKPPPAPKPAPKPKKATAKKPAADDELTTIVEPSTADSPTAKKHAAEQAAAKKAPPMEVPDDAKPYHRSVEGIEDIAKAVEARAFADIRPLTGGVTAETSLVTLADGSKLVRKSGGNPTAEHAASMLGRAMGIDVPRVYRNDPSEVWMGYVADGKTWAQLRSTADPSLARAAFESDEGKRIGLFDLLINNGDRNDGNWLLKDNRAVVAIDHGHAWNVPGVGRIRADIGRRGPFTDSYFSGYRELKDNDLTPADIAEVRRRLKALAPDFEHIGQPRWLEYALAVLDAIEPHAKGTRNLVAGAP